jgi:hypothetical protein
VDDAPDNGEDDVVGGSDDDDGATTTARSTTSTTTPSDAGVGFDPLAAVGCEVEFVLGGKCCRNNHRITNKVLLGNTTQPELLTAAENPFSCFIERVAAESFWMCDCGALVAAAASGGQCEHSFEIEVGDADCFNALWLLLLLLLCCCCCIPLLLWKRRNKEEEEEVREEEEEEEEVGSQHLAENPIFDMKAPPAVRSPRDGTYEAPLDMPVESSYNAPAVPTAPKRLQSKNAAPAAAAAATQAPLSEITPDDATIVATQPQLRATKSKRARAASSASASTIYDPLAGFAIPNDDGGFGIYDNTGSIYGEVLGPTIALVVPFRVHVVTPEGKRTITLPVDPDDKLWDLKKDIMAAEGIAIELQQLNFNGEPLMVDQTTLGHYGIKHDDTLHMSAAPIRLHVIQPDRVTAFTIEVPGDVPLMAVKVQIHASKGFAVASQLLEFKGTRLADDDKRLNVYGIKHNDTIHMLAPPKKTVASELADADAAAAAAAATAVVVPPQKYNKCHMIGARLLDRVVHLPLVPTDDGKGIRLATTGLRQPTFGWLPDLVMHYVSPRPKCPFALRNDVVGYPSLASPSRIEYDFVLADCFEQFATPPVLEDPGTYELIFNAMYNDLVEEVVDHVFDLDAAGLGSHLGTLKKHKWVAECDAAVGAGWPGGEAGAGSRAAAERWLEAGSLKLWNVGAAVAVDRAVEQLVGSTSIAILEEVLDSMVLDRAGVPAAATADGGGTLTAPASDVVWDHSYQDVYPWYIPDMSRSEVTEALVPMDLGDFIVYERLDQFDPALGDPEPASDPAPTIDKFDSVAVVSSDSDPEEASGEPVPAKPLRPAPEPPTPQRGFKPVAKRITMAARVVRRGEQLGVFQDDSALDVEVDQTTRMVLGRKKTKGSFRSYGQKLFPTLASKAATAGDAASPDATAALATELDMFLDETEELAAVCDKAAPRRTFRGVAAGVVAGVRMGGPGGTVSTVRPNAARRRSAAALQLSGLDLDALQDVAADTSVSGCKAPYTHGLIDRKTAIQRLVDARDANPVVEEGLFLVRGSKNDGGGFVLNVFNNGQVKNLLFTQDSAGVFKLQQLQFEAKDVGNLISKLMAGHTNMPVRLGHFVTSEGKVQRDLDYNDLSVHV